MRWTHDDEVLSGRAVRREAPALRLNSVAIACSIGWTDVAVAISVAVAIASAFACCCEAAW